jgi:tape measure domain-containing protein
VANDLTLKILIQAEVQAYLDALKKASASTDQLSNNLGKVEAPADAAAASLGNLVTGAAALAGLAVAATAVKDALAGIITTGAQFESLTTAVTGLMGSLLAGQDAMAWIKAFAINTPLELEGVTQAFIKLKAFGLDPMDGTMQALTDTVSRMGGGQEELEGVIMAVGQAWSKNKLQTEEALQLLERGVGVWDILAEAMGLTAEKLQDMATKGELGRDVITPATPPCSRRTPRLPVPRALL